MAVVNTLGSRTMTPLAAVPMSPVPAGVGGGRVHKWSETIETSAADSTTSTYTMARLPSNARIHGSSKISHDALGATTTTIDIGIFPVRSGDFTGDEDAINDGIVASTSGTKDFIKDRANWGKRLWEFINGQAADPKCDVLVKLTLLDAHLSSGAGTITVEIDYSTD